MIGGSAAFLADDGDDYWRDAVKVLDYLARTQGVSLPAVLREIDQELWPAAA
jgi:hypothetical protein